MRMPKVSYLIFSALSGFLLAGFIFYNFGHDKPGSSMFFKVAKVFVALSAWIMIVNLILGQRKDKQKSHTRI